MSEEGNTPEQTPEANPIETQAREMGWRPKEEFEGDASKWVTADIFVARAPLFEKIDHQSRELKAMKQTMNEFRKHHEKVAEMEYKRAMEDLRAQRRVALEDGDLVTAEEIRDKMDVLQKPTLPPEPTVQQPPKEFVEWQEKNTWYAQDEELRDFADFKGVQLARQGVAPNEVLKQVSAIVKKQFPDKFKNPARERASAVESPTSNAPKKDTFKLTPEQERIMERFVKSGVVTREKYIEGLKKLQGE
jgi:hypothetical protein